MADKCIVQNGHVKPSVKTLLKFLCFAVAAVCLASLAAGCSAGPQRSGKSYVIKGKRYHILATADGYKEKGLASWYGKSFHGRKTASGEVYNMNGISAAHKTLPLHTWVEVKNLRNNKAVILRINDRGPFIDGRIIDLSQAAAKELGVYQPGTAPVVVTAVSPARARQLDRQRGRGSTASNAPRGRMRQ